MFGLEKKRGYDFVAVGDMTTDAFIRLKDAHIHCNSDELARELCVSFGDKIPYEFVEVVPAVGNSANASVAAARLQLRSAFISNIGGDDNGKTCLATLSKEEVNTDFVTVHKSAKTNYHYVLWYADDRTILVKHEHYDYKFPQNLPPPKWIYLSPIGSGTENYHMEIADYLDKNHSVKLAFQPGTFQMSLGLKKLERIYRRTEVFFVNVEEAQRILETKDPSPEMLAKKIAELGPRISVITDGPRGAYVFDGQETWFMPPYPDIKPPFERTGAGDAFSSTLICALAKGLPLMEALRWAPVSSMLVVQKIGAQAGLPTEKTIKKYLSLAKPDYKPKKLNPKHSQEKGEVLVSRHQ